MSENISFNISESSIIKNALTKPSTVFNLSTTTPSKSKSSVVPSTPKSSVSTFKLSSTNLSRSAVKNMPNTPSTPRARSPSAGSISSINSVSRDAARLAKEQNTKERIQKVAELKEKWAREKVEKLLNHKTKSVEESQKLHDISSKLEEQRKKNLERQREYEWNMKAAERETLTTYSKDRHHAKVEVERINKEKKRFSIMLRSELNMKFKKNASILDINAKEEELSLLESRRLDAIAVREMKIVEQEKKRQSMIFRVESSQKQRLIQQSLDEQHDDYERSLIQTRYLNWKDEQHYHDVNDAQRRISLMHRGEIWKRQRDYDNEHETHEKEEELIHLQSRYEDWKDIEEYKKRQQQHDRESLEGRWMKYQHDRQCDIQEKIHQDELNEYESEMKRQAHEDMMIYQETMTKMRRTSLAYRLDKAKKDHDYDNGQKMISDHIHAEEQRFRKQDQDDVDAYLQKMCNDRRQSLEYRNQLEFQERMRLEGEHYNQVEKDHDDRILSYGAWQDVQAYQQQCRDERRQSLAQRLVVARQQHQQSIEEHSIKLDVLHDEFNLRRVDWSVKDDMMEEEKKRRRFSMALRLDSWRMQRLAEEKLKEKKRMIEEENIRYRMQDWEELQRVKEEMKHEEQANLMNKMVF